MLTFFVFRLFVVSGLCGHLHNGGCGVLRPYGRLLRVASYASIEPARPSSQTSFHPHHLSYRQHPGLELMQVAGIYCYLLLGIQPALYRYPRYGFAVRILVSRRNEVSNSLTFFVFRLFVVSGLCGISPKISLISLISLVKRLCLFRKRP